MEEILVSGVVLDEAETLVYPKRPNFSCQIVPLLRCDRLSASTNVSRNRGPALGLLRGQGLGGWGLGVRVWLILLH